MFYLISRIIKDEFKLIQCLFLIRVMVELVLIRVIRVIKIESYYT